MAERESGIDRDRAAANVCADRRAIAEMLSVPQLGAVMDLELTLHQLKVLLLVAAGLASSGRDLVDRLHVTAPTVSGTLDRLVELGYVVRVESPDDRRMRLLRPTDAGRRVYEDVLGLRDVSDRLLAELDDDELEALSRGLGALRRAWSVHVRGGADGATVDRTAD